jgi:hypothetical protein
MSFLSPAVDIASLPILLLRLGFLFFIKLISFLFLVGFMIAGLGRILVS